MLKEELYDNFLERIKKDYTKALREKISDERLKGEKEVECAIRNAYPIAFFNEVRWFFEDLDYEDFDQDELLEKVLNNPHKNFVIFAWDFWLDFRNPELYNIFSYNIMWDILIDVLNKF